MGGAGPDAVAFASCLVLGGLAALLYFAQRAAGMPAGLPWRPWCAGLVLAGVGLALVPQSGPGSLAPQMAVSHSLLLAGYGLVVATLARMLGGWLWPWALALPVLAVLSLVGLTRLGLDHDATAWVLVLAHLAVLAQAGLAMADAWRGEEAGAVRIGLVVCATSATLLLAWPLLAWLEAPEAGWALARGSWLAWPVLASGVMMLVRHAQQRAQLERRATLDGLTGVWNRRTFLELSARALAHDRRLRLPSCLLMIDIDHFKQVNDTYGHDVGDAVLRELCERTQGLLRAEDVLGRVGGEEFAALLPGTPEDGARQVAERIRETIASGNFLCSGEEIPVRVSIGVAERAPGEADVEPLMQRADMAMYAAKRGGRNRVMLSSQLRLPQAS